jgi:hypothetical protein
VRNEPISGRLAFRGEGSIFAKDQYKIHPKKLINRPYRFCITCSGCISLYRFILNIIDFEIRGAALSKVPFGLVHFILLFNSSISVHATLLLSTVQLGHEQPAKGFEELLFHYPT